MPGMAPFKHNLKILQGATFNDLVTWKTGVTLESATPVDLTGCTGRSQIRAKIESPDVLASFTTENGGLELGGALGTIRHKMNAVASAALTWKTGVYDTEIIFPDGTVVRRMAGSVSVSPEVTRV